MVPTSNGVCVGSVGQPWCPLAILWVLRSGWIYGGLVLLEIQNGGGNSALKKRDLSGTTPWP